MSVDYIRVTMPELYPYVLTAAGAISFWTLLVGFGAGRMRSSLFNDHDKIKEKYYEEHQNNFKKDLPKGGYPDNADGLFGDELMYDEWWNFSQDQQKQKFFLEQVTSLVFMLLIIGLVYPITSLVWVLCHTICMHITSYGHKTTSFYRMLGGVPMNMSLLFAGSMAIVSLSDMISSIPKVE